MPAISTPTPTALPDLRARQTDVLTQILSRPGSGLTTAVVTLGNPTPTFTPGPPMTTTAFGIPTPVHTDYWANVHLSQPAIGAILGGVVAVVVIGLIGGYCLFASRRAHRGSRSRRSSRRSSRTSGSSPTSSAKRRKHKSRAHRKPILIPSPMPLPATYRTTWKPQIIGVDRYP